MNRISALSKLFLGSVMLAGCSQEPVEIRLVTPQLPFDQQVIEVLQSALKTSPYFRLELVPQSDSELSALDLLDRGVAEMALVPNNTAFRGGVETVIPLYSSVLHIAFRQDVRPVPGEGLSTDLFAGKTVFAGPPESSSRTMMRQTADRLGIDYSSIRFVDSITPRPDVIVLFAPVKPGLMDDFLDYRLFSMGSADELGQGSRIESLSLMHPEFQPVILPENTYPGVVDQPVVTIAVNKLLVARSDVSPALVYDLISEILRLRPALSAIYPGLFHSLSGDFDPSSSRFVVHAGAQAFAERDAPSIYERYSGVAEVAVTLLVGVVSGGFAIVKLYRIRRKNRIDRFYERVIAIRKSMLGSEDEGARNAAVTEIRGLQDEAFELLAGEKLAADESFRIFITLSNDIIDDLRASFGHSEN